jgi:hypothetical protein
MPKSLQMPEIEIPIKEFDPEIIEPNTKTYQKETEDGNKTGDGNKIVIIGSPGSGKSWLVKWILYMKKHIFPCGIVFSGTEDTNGFYSGEDGMMPDLFVYNTLDIDALESYIKRQKVARKYLDNPWSVCILDDCTDDPKIMSTPLFQGIFKNGRHWNFLFILIMQYCMDVKPGIRAAIDGTFIFKNTSLNDRKKIYENYASIIPSFPQFCKAMDNVTGDYTALFIHNKTQSRDWRDCVFYAKAKNTPKGFKFGCETFWDHDEQRYNKEYTPFI